MIQSDELTFGYGLSDSSTAACRLPSPGYPSTPPFHPDSHFPESPNVPIGSSNRVYAGVRQLFHLLELDAPRYGTTDWNPLGTIVRPGDKVLIKPNFISHAHRYEADQWEQIITHGSIIRAVVDYVLIALQGSGEVWIADGPQLDAHWEQLLQRTGMTAVEEWYRIHSKVPVKLIDLRDTWEDMRGDVLYGTKQLPGDPAGAVEVNLANRSRFAERDGSGRYYGANYNQAETNFHHSGGRHEYRLSKTAASADVLINLPKMKTHKKVGVTLCLKNLVGINSGRNWLPHHTDGDPSNGGDQFPQPSLRNKSERWGVRHLERLTLNNPKVFAPFYRLAKRICTPFWGHTREAIRSGNWHGNDTCWRMVHDINRCTLYSDGNAFPTASPKRYFAIVDGVVAGDGDGPAAPDRQDAGVLVGGFNPVAVDCVTTRLMGFDPMLVPTLSEAFAASDLPLAPFNYADISIRSNRAEWNRLLSAVADKDTFHFRPHFGWRGKIESRQEANRIAAAV
jgi:uncharacterized protein (DUF362 family)